MNADERPEGRPIQTAAEAIAPSITASSDSHADPRRDHDRDVASLLDAFDSSRIVGEYATSADGVPGKYGHDAWGDESVHHRDEPASCSCCPKTTPAERAWSVERYGRGSESGFEPGPRCECGAPAVVSGDPDEELMCSLWWRGGVHHCEVCRRRPGRWRGHAWCCDRCVERVVGRFRSGLDQGAGR
jgi:hypothetical protein